MARPSTGLVGRLAALVVALVVGPATIAPGTAEAPAASVALGGESATAAQQYGWGVMQWDFAWEFGESLDSQPYRGADITSGRWVEESNGTGRAVKFGGGVEFHSGYFRRTTASPDFGTTSLTLQGQPARLGRWELKERSDELEGQWGSYRFIAELVPANPADYDCGAHNLTIAQVTPGRGSTIRIGVNAGRTSWNRTLSGYQRGDLESRTYAVQVTGRRITWFVNSRAVASVGAKAAIPKVPMTVRFRLVGDGTKVMNNSVVKLDWVRGYDLKRGTRPSKGLALSKGSYGAAC